jgi:hypothetical protein
MSWSVAADSNYDRDVKNTLAWFAERSPEQVRNLVAALDETWRTGSPTPRAR